MGYLLMGGSSSIFRKRTRWTVDSSVINSSDTSGYLQSQVELYKRTKAKKYSSNGLLQWLQYDMTNGDAQCLACSVQFCKDATNQVLESFERRHMIALSVFISTLVNR